MLGFEPKGRSVLIGSLPMVDHREAADLVWTHTPNIPLWIQLPIYKAEGMMSQFLPGFPGLIKKEDTWFIDSESDNFDDDLLKFYEEYMSVVEEENDVNDSRFVLSSETAEGFFVFMEKLGCISHLPDAVKGQMTGPITFTTGVKDQDGRAVFYNEQLRDTAVKLIAGKARWQVLALKKFNCPVLLFFDEPALAGFGSSAFISISKEEISTCFDEVIQAVHTAGGLAGIHVCSNTEWSLVLDSAADIVSFDAYAYFEKFLLYSDRITAFINRGGILAWGIVPTLNPEDIEKETIDSLVAKWQSQFQAIVDLGIDKSRLFAQSLITPSCGTGSLQIGQAKKVIELTQGISERIRRDFS